MESIFPSGIVDILPPRHSPPPCSCTFLAFRSACSVRLSSRQHDARFFSLRLRSVSRDVSGSDAGGDEANGSVILPAAGSLSSSEIDSHLGGGLEMDVSKNPEPVRPVTGGSGSRAGLFRTPISGGVQSATSAHDLPSPALAVRNLMEQARFAHLCTVMSRMHHRRAGYPFGSLVDFAADSMGHPIFSLSPLAIHTRNLLADPRCTLVVQIPGWSSLSNARVTIFGDVTPLPSNQQEWARKQYMAKHQQWASHQWGNFYYYRMQNIRFKTKKMIVHYSCKAPALDKSDIYFIGGFGTVAWIDVNEYEATQPDKIAADGGEQSLKELNGIFSKPLKELLSTETEIDDAALISIDSKGTDIRVRQGAQFNIQRLSFEVEHSVETLDEAKKALQKIIKNKSFKLERSS
ncbi:uncharacterized protein LOC121992268 isoform X1 [Zingiber officinale]|uniref:uncharacterized protein LOC121992268 isoform X1 n=1 Tax=Zingiber officinale TaxID=94328 RepID=UPI001C4B2EC1|nr:uncharacterized protein LOC121992268 isoform X1 [Zingiber officinale]